MIKPAPLPIPLRPAAFAANLLVALSLFCGAGGVFVLAGAESGRAALIQAGGVVRTASVTETRVMQQGRHGRSYELRYKVKDPAGRTHTATDITGRGDLWVSIPKDDWDAANRTGTIAVRIVPDHPSLNAPVAASAGNMGDLLGAFVLAGLLAICGAAVGWTAIQRRPRANPQT